jgi:hypothetical protein
MGKKGERTVPTKGGGGVMLTFVGLDLDRSGRQKKPRLLDRLGYDYRE